MAQTEASWEGWIEQGDQRWPMQATVKLKREPFRMVFTAPEGYGFALVSSVSQMELAPLAVKPDLGGAVRGTNIGAESPDRTNVDLTVNEVGIVRKDFTTAQLWNEAPKFQQFSFQTRQQGTDQRWTSTRRIDEICTANGRSRPKCAPVSQSPVNGIAVLVAGVPPAASLSFRSPRLFQIEFE